MLYPTHTTNTEIYYPEDIKIFISISIRTHIYTSYQMNFKWYYNILFNTHLLSSEPASKNDRSLIPKTKWKFRKLSNCPDFYRDNSKVPVQLFARRSSTFGTATSNPNGMKWHTKTEARITTTLELKLKFSFHKKYISLEKEMRFLG